MTVKALLAHDFFLEDTGLLVELIRNEDEIPDKQVIPLRLRVVDPKKRRDTHKENEAIQFEFALEQDKAEEIAAELVCCFFATVVITCLFLVCFFTLKACFQVKWPKTKYFQI